jgi:putative ABC transport system permease protein
MLSDLRSALRLFPRRPAFCLVAILTLALGAGANTAAFNVVYRVLIRPLPFRDPDRLLLVWEATPVLPQLQVSLPDFEDWRARNHSFQAISAYTFQAVNQVTILGSSSDLQPEQVHATQVTSDLFDTMGIAPLIGRTFTAEEDRTQQTVVLIAEKLWRRRFSADPRIAGKPLRIGDRSFTVVGVVPDAQAYPPWAEIWMPYSWNDPATRTTRRFHPLEVIARLKPGVTEAAAQTEMQAIARDLARAYAQTNGNVTAYTTPLMLAVTGETRPALLLVWAAVGLVLLITCANLAHLMLARVLDRHREMSIRAALGAGRAGLIRQVLVEGIVLALPGGALGIALAIVAGRFLQRLGQGQIPRLDEAGLAMPAWWFAAAISAMCGVLLALPSCWQVFRTETDLAGVGGLSRGGHLTTRRRSRFSVALILTQVALAFVVLTGADLLVRSFAGILRQDPGFQSGKTLAVDVTLPPGRFDWNAATQFFGLRLLPALRAVPGMEDAAAANCAPMSLGPTERSRFATRFGVEGHTYDVGRYPVAQTRWVTPEYFRVLGIPLLRGRFLTETDRGQPRYLINETLARQFFPGVDPTTRHLTMNVTQPHPDSNEIAGVVGDVRELGLDQSPSPTVYTLGSSPRMTLLLRTAGDPHAIVAAVRDVIAAQDPEIAVPALQSLDDYVTLSLARRRFVLSLLASLGILAALLTAAGIYGLFAYTVSARTAEFGVRAALGAAPGNLLRMILRESAGVTLPGVLIGCLPALVFARLMKGMLYGVSPADPLSLAVAAALLLAIALLSAWLPAHRAAMVDPCVSLRAE